MLASLYRDWARTELAAAWAEIPAAERETLSRRQLYRRLRARVASPDRETYLYRVWLRECWRLLGRPPRRWPKNAPPLPFEE